MSEITSAIVSKVWGMCNPLRDDGVSYADYFEKLTYLIFLKMSDEYSKPPYKRETGIPKGYTWSDMNTLKGAELETQYKNTKARSWKHSIRTRSKNLEKKAASSVRFSRAQSIRSAMWRFFTVLFR